MSSLHPTRAGCHTLLCHPRGSGGPALSWDVVWIPAFAGMTASFMSPHKSGSQGLVVSSLHPTRAGCHTRLCHRRGSGGPVLSWDVVWIPAFAGMTASFMAHPRKRGARLGRVFPAFPLVRDAIHSCVTPRKRGSSPVVGRRLDSRLSGNDILFHVTPARVGVQAWSCLHWIPLTRDDIPFHVASANSASPSTPLRPLQGAKGGCPQGTGRQGRIPKGRQSLRWAVTARSRWLGSRG